MTPFLYRRSVDIHRSISDLFAFHLDTNNVVKITPPDTKVEILELEPPLKEGSRVVLKATKFFIPQIWEVRIEKVVAPSLIVDLAERSPFAYWRHEHRFEETAEGTLMTDRVEFLPPLDPAGRIALPLIHKSLEAMFAYRHETTKALMEADQ